jgi:hypothetical protein
MGNDDTGSYDLLTRWQVRRGTDGSMEKNFLSVLPPMAWHKSGFLAVRQPRFAGELEAPLTFPGYFRI